MTDIRQAALGLYNPPFCHTSGLIVDANNRTVTDLPIARIRGWGRIQYLDNPRELQDEVGLIVAEALNLYWAKSQGGQHGTDT